MPLSGVLALALTLGSSAGGDRLLLCRPRIDGDPALARGEAVVEAARRMGTRFLDYGVVCEDASEGARAARRAGLGHAVAATAQGRSDGTRYVLTLARAEDETVRAQRVLEVAPGADAARPLRTALEQLVDALPAAPGPRPAEIAAWTVVGVGAAALAASLVFAAQAREAADRARGATDFGGYQAAQADWARSRRASGFLAAGGAVAVGVGLAWRFTL